MKSWIWCSFAAANLSKYHNYYVNKPQNWVSLRNEFPITNTRYRFVHICIWRPINGGVFIYEDKCVSMKFIYCLFLLHFAFGPSDKYPEPEPISKGLSGMWKKKNLYEKKWWFINHKTFYFFVHFQSKIISNFQLDRKKSQMTSNFRNSFPSLHIFRAWKSPLQSIHQEYCHQQRCTICDSLFKCAHLRTPALCSHT